MDWTIRSGRNAGKSHALWQFLLNDARRHILETGQPFVASVFGFIPGKPELEARVTFEIVKLPDAPES